MRILNMITLTLLIVGGLNWGTFALFGLDMVAGLFGGPDSILSNIVYFLVAASAIYCAVIARPFLRLERAYNQTSSIGYR